MNHAPRTKHQDTDLPEDVVLSVRHVSKKFCRNLRRSMWYGMQDLGRNLLGIRPKPETGNLKPEWEERMKAETGNLSGKKG